MKTWTFGKRMAVGFGAVTLIVLILGSISAFLMRQGSQNATTLSRDYIKALNLVSEFNESANDLRINITPYILNGAPDRLQGVRTAMTSLASASKNLTELMKQTPSLSSVAPFLPVAQEKVAAYERNVEETIQAMLAFQETRMATSKIGPVWSQATDLLVTRQYQLAQEEIKGKPTSEQSLDALRRVFLAAEIRAKSTMIRLVNTKGQAYRDVKEFDAATDLFKKLEAATLEIEPLLKQPEDLQALADVRKCAAEYQKMFATVSSSFVTIDSCTQKRNVLAGEFNTAVDNLFHGILDLTTTSTVSTASSLNFGTVFITIGVIVALFLACGLGLLITKSTSSILRRITDQLSAGAMETASAAEQLSTGSQSLALGANDQAASLEETSASMEEMTSMTKRNAENAVNAKTLAQQTRESAEKAEHDISMMTDGLRAVANSAQDLSKAMLQIQSSSSAITTVLKTIDEIAFQTNILSLNAAVEAARAGEAGAGFAVVADEVRALAQRSAEAARETAKMIKEASDNSQRGMTVTEKVGTDLSQMDKMAQQVNAGLQSIVTQARRVDEVIAEIATACQEQSQGIGQVNTALTQMDKVTQSNAASAEESASAAEEVSAQAAESRIAVNHLLTLIGSHVEEPAPTGTRLLQPPAPVKRTPAIKTTAHRASGHKTAVTITHESSKSKTNSTLDDAMDSHFKDH